MANKNKSEANVDLEDVTKMLAERLKEGGVDMADLLHAAEGLLGDKAKPTPKAAAKAPAKTKAAAKAKSTTYDHVPLDWNEVYYTN
ncbi:MAG: hypothetical protein WBV78_09775, partial [Roseobacter sp.]